jgi:predicted Zn-dependent protease with MMP-like domain
MKLSARKFDAAVQRAIERIPDEIRQHLDEVTVTVKDWPTREMLESVGMGPDDTLFGLYEGTALDERSDQDIARLPDTIYIFQGALEEACETKEELEEEIEITVAHEVAHMVGMDEDELRELGYE